MRKTVTLLSTIALLSLSFTASAFEADFSAKIRGVNTENNKARVVSIANFKDTNIQRDGTFTVAYEVTDNFENLVFSGSAAIDATATEVTVGNKNIGKITMKHDIGTGLIKTRFVKKVIHSNGSGDTPITNYNVVATSGVWIGESSITSILNIESEELVFPEQITIEGTAVYTGPQFFIDSVEIRIAGELVYSGTPDAESFSIPVNTDLDGSFVSEIDDISVVVYADYDGGPLVGNAISSLSPDQTTYNLGNIPLMLLPQ